jgi:hypothetical protein
MSPPEHLRDLVPDDYLDPERYPLLVHQMIRALELLDAPWSARFVGVVIAARYANRVDDPDWPGGSIFPSVDPVLVKARALSDRTIRRAIEWLDEHGVLVKTGRKRGHVAVREVGWSGLLHSRSHRPDIGEEGMAGREPARSGADPALSGAFRSEGPATPDPRPRTKDPEVPPAHALSVEQPTLERTLQDEGGSKSDADAREASKTGNEEEVIPASPSDDDAGGYERAVADLVAEGRLSPEQAKRWERGR